MERKKNSPSGPKRQTNFGKLEKNHPEGEKKKKVPPPPERGARKSIHLRNQLPDPRGNLMVSPLLDNFPNIISDWNSFISSVIDSSFIKSLKTAL